MRIPWLKVGIITSFGDTEICINADNTTSLNLADGFFILLQVFPNACCHNFTRMVVQGQLVQLFALVTYMIDKIRSEIQGKITGP